MGERDDFIGRLRGGEEIDETQLATEALDPEPRVIRAKT
jgi:hypothetical protein